MAKYTIQHKCGHEQVHVLQGPETSRERKIEWLKTTLCQACYNAERAAAYAQEQEYAAQKNKELNLPALEGTEKQVSFAETIRAKRYAQIADLIAKSPNDEQLIQDVKSMLNETQATYWISSRYQSLNELIQKKRNERIAEAILNKTNI